VSDSFTIKIDRASFDDAIATLQLLKSYLPTRACTSITESAVQTQKDIITETVNTLNVDEQRVRAEIETLIPDTETLDGYKAEIISKGKPIEMIDFAIDAAGWDWRHPKPINIKIFKDGSTHEFRHVFVSKGHMYGRQKNKGGEAAGRVYAWMKYVAKTMALRYPIERLQTVRIQDIQAQPYFIDPITEAGAEAIVSEYKKAVEEVFASVW
jgi:hypothetical protein